MARTSLAPKFEQSITLDALRAYIAEFISTFFYVFAVIGSTMSSRNLVPNAASDPSSLVAVAVTDAFALAFALASAVFMAANISGGHVNPAVTFAMAVGGHISVPTALFYWIAQMLASVLACVVLKVVIIGQHIPTYAIAEEMTGFGASVMEGVVTFTLVYTIYAAGDPRRGTFGAIGPLVIGMTAGAHVLATGPFSGGSMNPASAFASSIVAGTFKNQAAYWVGPLFGATIAGLLYDNVVFPGQAAVASDGVRQ